MPPPPPPPPPLAAPKPKGARSTPQRASPFDPAPPAPPPFGPGSAPSAPPSHHTAPTSRASKSGGAPSAGGPIRTPKGRISKASVDPVERAKATMRFGAGQGSTGRAFNADRVAGGGKARNNHASRADDLNPVLERMMEVADDAFDFAQRARSNGGKNSDGGGSRALPPHRPPPTPLGPMLATLATPPPALASVPATTRPSGEARC